MAINKDENTQILITLPNELLDEIDNYWHENKLRSRSETIRELLRKSLEGK